MPEPGPELVGLRHLIFIVADLDRMERLLVEGLGARKVYDSGSATFSLSEERFYLLGAADLWIAVMRGAPLPERSYNHVALKVAEDALERFRSRLEALGLACREGRSRVDGEGRSLYFHDFDNHLFELHTGTLEARLRRYASAPPESLSQETGTIP